VLRAAPDRDDLPFVVTNSGPATTPARQNRYAFETAVRAGDVSEADVRTALTTYDRLVEAGRRDANFTEVQRLLATPGGHILTSQYWSDLDQRLWEFEKRKQDHNPIPDVLGLRCPHVALFGAADQLVAVPQSVQLFAEAACRPGRHQRFDLTLAVFPGADHRIRRADGT
jgi:hypothetical protein